MNTTDKPLFGLTTLICIVIAGMIGAGVFTTSGFSLSSLHSAPLVLLAWGIGGLIAMCGAHSYGELARRMPQSGGEYLYLTQQLHPFLGFLSGWVSLTAGFSAAIAFAARTCEQYALPDSIRPDWLEPRTLATVFVLICGAGHSWLIRPAALLQNTVVILKLLAIVGFILIGLFWIQSNGIIWSSEFAGETESVATATTDVHATPTDLAPPTATIYTFASSLMWISLSYAGFNQAIYIASEVQNPVRNVPRALMLGTIATTVVYLLLNFVFLATTPGQLLQGQVDVAAIAAAQIGGWPLEVFMRAIIAVATFSSVASMIMTGPRVYSRMASDGVFPRFFAETEGGLQRSVLLQTTLAVVLVHQTTIYGLLQYLGTILSMSSALAVFTLLIGKNNSQPSKNPDADSEQMRPTPPWTYQATAITYVGATILIVVLMIMHDVWQLAGTAITLAAGTVLWTLIPHKMRSQPTSG